MNLLNFALRREYVYCPMRHWLYLTNADEYGIGLVRAGKTPSSSLVTSGYNAWYRLVTTVTADEEEQNDQTDQDLR